jgi:prepilin-type N-terminal cleavage/methylation domain-containing protein
VEKIVAMRKALNNRVRGERGFSMVELLMTVAVMLVLTAFVVPNIIQITQIYRLNGATTSLQNIFEVARLSAIRRNTQINLRQTTLGGQWLFYVDLNGTGNYATTDSSYLLPLDMQIAPTEAPAASTTLLSNLQALDSNGCIGFDSRGTVNYAICGAGTPVVCFISIGMGSSNSGFRAVTVTTMGQAKAWTALANGVWNTM